MELAAHWIVANHRLFDEIGIAALMGYAAWIVLSTGQVSLGTGGFAAIGSYCVVHFAGTEHWPLLAAVAAGVAAAAAAGFVFGLPLARLGSAQFAIATMAFGEFAFLALRGPIEVGKTLAGAAAGGAITAAIYGALAIAAFALWRLMISRDGRALSSVAQDEEAASGLGIDPARAKHIAIVASALVAGLAGALVAASGGVSWIGVGLDQSIGALAAAVIGGSAALAGPVVGAAIITLIHVVVRGPQAYATITEALLLLACIVVLPRGLLSVFASIGAARPAAERRA